MGRLRERFGLNRSEVMRYVRGERTEPSASRALPATAESSMTRQDVIRGGRMPRHDQPTKDADQQR